MRQTIFVSYSHNDERFRKLFETAGKGRYGEAFKLWSDCDILAGTGWKAAIDGAIAGARGILLLVSNDFLESDFINKTELRTILDRQALGEPSDLTIWWVPLEELSQRSLTRAKLNPLQAAWTGKPLSQLRGKARTGAVRQILSRLAEDVRPDRINLRDEFRQKLAEALGTKTVIQEMLAEGEYAVFYKARRPGTDVAVKALVPAPGREWLATDFVRRANAVRNVTNSTAITIRDVLTSNGMDGGVSFAVMEFVCAPTLKSKLAQDGPLAYPLIADVLAQLVRVAADLSRMADRPIIGPVRPSHVHYDAETGKARISLLSIVNETLDSCRDHPTLLLGADALTYLSPERHDGRALDVRSDQYYLGLLGLELVLRTPPVEVKTFADLDRKQRFFESPREFFGKLPSEQPAFSFVLARMLERAPEKRWQKMSELADALQQIAAGTVPDRVKRHADDDYNDKLCNTGFFRSFYRSLFAQPLDIERLFHDRGVSMDDQYAKLDDAMALILNFSGTMQATTLRTAVARHGALGLKGEHFEAFRKAFLNALGEAKPADEYSQEAWRAILDPALGYMQGKLCPDGDCCPLDQARAPEAELA
jgi:hypothetical protein